MKKLTSSPGLRFVSPQEYATRLIASVAFLVNTISLESDALMNVATFFLANSYASVAFALHWEQQEAKLIQSVVVIMRVNKRYGVLSNC